MDLLPDELVEIVARSLPPEDLRSLSQTSRRFRGIVESDATLWARAHLWAPLYKHERHLYFSAVIVFLSEPSRGLSYSIESRMPLAQVLGILERAWREVPSTLHNLDNAYVKFKRATPAGQRRLLPSPSHPQEYGLIHASVVHGPSSLLAFLAPPGSPPPDPGAMRDAEYLFRDFCYDFHGQCFTMGNLALSPPRRLEVAQEDDGAVRSLAAMVSFLDPGRGRAVSSALDRRKRLLTSGSAPPPDDPPSP